MSARRRDWTESVFREHLARHHGSLSGVARALRVTRQTVYLNLVARNLAGYARELRGAREKQQREEVCLIPEGGDEAETLKALFRMHGGMGSRVAAALVISRHQLRARVRACGLIGWVRETREAVRNTYAFGEVA